jgi:hypothetical protein
VRKPDPVDKKQRFVANHLRDICPDFRPRKDITEILLNV